MKTRQAVAAFVLAFAVLAPVAQATTHSGNVAAQHQSATSEGEVRRIDREAKKLTIRHGPIQNLDMPAMTMVFQVADPTLLDRVKQGDKVRFTADKVGGAYTVTQIEPLQ